MSAVLAAAENTFAESGLVLMGLLTVAFIMNVSSLQTKDMNRKSAHATSLLLLALLIESSTWTIRAFLGGSEAGAFWVIVAAAGVHCVSAVLALIAIGEHRAVGRWPHGRRRASWGFWLNVSALFALAAWFWLGASPTVYKRIFE